MRDIDSDAQINIIDRGNGSQIATFQEEACTRCSPAT